MSETRTVAKKKGSRMTINVETVTNLQLAKLKVKFSTPDQKYFVQNLLGIMVAFFYKNPEKLRELLRTKDSK